MISGIYKITCWITNKFYIGNAIYIERRIAQHKYTLRQNKHDNSYLQAAWNKYGEENFYFTVIEIIEYPDVNKLIEREQYWIDTLKACNRNIGYNLRPNANSNLGIKFSDEFKNKISKLKLGKKMGPMSAETKERLSKSKKGKRQSVEHKLKLSIAHKGKKNPKLAEFKKGKKPSEKIKLKMKESQRIRREREIGL